MQSVIQSRPNKVEVMVQSHPEINPFWMAAPINIIIEKPYLNELVMIIGKLNLRCNSIPLG